MKTRSASGTSDFTAAAPWTSILRMTSWPAGQRAPDLGPRRGIPVAVDLGPLQEGARVPERREPLAGQEVVADAVDARRAAGAASCRSRRSGSPGRAGSRAGPR